MRHASAKPGQQAAPAALPPSQSAQAKATLQQDVAQAIEHYWQQQARRPPAGAAGFDPLVSPAWAGRQIPG